MSYPRQINAPCKDCPDRKPGCWGQCPKYKDFAARNAERLETERRERSNENDFVRTRSYKQVNWPKKYRKERQP